MIARKLPPQGQMAAPARSCFSDHTLLTERISEAYNGSGFVPGPGILWMLSGHGRFVINGETHRIDQTRYLIIAETSSLSIRLRSAGVQPLLLFFQSDLVSQALRRQDIGLNWLERAHPMDRPLRESLTWLHQLGNNCGSFSALRADALIGDILSGLIFKALAARSIANRLSVSRNSTRIQLFRRLSVAREWIDANYASPLTLDDIAGQATLNSQHFLRNFRDCFGVTPHQYLTSVRLSAAEQLLTATTQSVTAICRLTGFESLSSFSGLFRQHFGLSPKAYRAVTPSAHSAVPASGSADPGRLPIPISN